MTLGWRQHGRRLGLGLATLAGWPAGVFIPASRAYNWRRTSPVDAYPKANDQLAAARPSFTKLLERMESYAGALAAINGPAPQPRWSQDWFPGLDAAVAYVLVRDLQPATIIEVGSGHSTRFMARAIVDGGLRTRLIAIDPYPRAGLPNTIVEHLAKPLSQVDPQLFTCLAPGDMLFVDSSHVFVPGSDTESLFTNFVPSLPPGTLVHVHDVFLPDDYPHHWRWRGYNEQGVVAMALAMGMLSPIWASHYVRTRMTDALSHSAAGQLPRPLAALESSLWMKVLTRPNNHDGV